MIDWKDVTSGFVAQVLATLAIPVVLYLAARLATIATSRSRSANVRNWIIPSEIENGFRYLPKSHRHRRSVLVLGWLGTVVVLSAMDVAIPPLGFPNLMSEWFPVPSQWGVYQGLSTGAEYKLRFAGQEAAQILRQADEAKAGWHLRQSVGDAPHCLD
jgi:hypothetical protein